MPKIFIEVHGGLVQNITTTSADVEVYVRDYDNMIEGDEQASEHDIQFTYWKAKGGDKIVSDKTFKKLINEK